MSRGKLYAMVGGMGVMAVVAAVALTLVFSRGGSGPAGSSPEPVASAVGLAQASGETVTSVGGPAKALPQGGPVSGSGLEGVAAAAPSGGGTSEGIKVHGHWTIEVREPDGTLASRTEFENAFAGALALNDFLLRNFTVGGWDITVFADVGICTNSTGSLVATCDIVPSGDAFATSVSTQVFKNLTAQVGSGANAGKLVLSGNITASGNGNVTGVATTVGRCVASTTTPSACTTSGRDTGQFFTFSTGVGTVPTPKAVVAGQQVLFTVVFSFS